MGKAAAQKARKNAANNKKNKTKRQKANPSGEKKSLRRHSGKAILGGQASGSVGSDSGDNASAGRAGETQDLQTVLEAYSKEQLITLLCDAALTDSALHARINGAAETDVSHRKVFIHSLPWDATEETLRQTFSRFGPVDGCNVVVDKASGRGKGYGFVMFRSRSGAVKALKQPQKQIGSRLIYCQLASVGPGSASGGGTAARYTDTKGRKIYVSNVPAEANAEKLRVFFAKFGEIELGPTGFDLVTGKSKGYAMFVYKTQEGARKVLQEPYKMFEGHQLHCQFASDPSKTKEPSSIATTGLVGTAPQPVLAAVAAAQNLQLYSQNPAYAALLGHNPLLTAAAGVNPAATVNPSMYGSSLDAGLTGYGGSSSLLGAYGAESTSGLQGMQYGHSSLSRLGGSYDRMSSYL